MQHRDYASRSHRFAYIYGLNIMPILSLHDKNIPSLTNKSKFYSMHHWENISHAICNDDSLQYRERIKIRI